MSTDLAGLFTNYPESPYRVPMRTDSNPAATKFDLGDMPTNAKDKLANDVDRDEAEKETADNTKALTELQELLYAEDKRSVLIVLQAIDAGGKDSTIRRCFGHLNPAGVRVWSFKVPTPLELSHDYLWRYHDKTPADGNIGIFNRSHYESVLVERVKKIVPTETIHRRYAQINAWEQMLVSEGTVILKFFLHLSADEQAERFADRLTREDKWWKFSASDLEERKRWKDYQQAFRDALAACSTPWAPWYAIPADQKWYRDTLVTRHHAQCARGARHELADPGEGYGR